MASLPIRNFCILAHINHGKSTLADRLLEQTGTVPAAKMREQFMDSLDLERERGVTIKLKAVRLHYTLNLPAQAGAILYTLNLIDTPGHTDFSYEVSRSLNACEGALLLVDAAVGLQAQTLAHFEKAKQAHLKILPVINKIDLRNAQTETVARDLAATFGFPPEEILRVSAKEGWGVKELLKEIIKRIPPPGGRRDGPLRALVFDSKYDEHKGVLAYVRVVDGALKIPNSKIQIPKLFLLGTKAVFEPVGIGYFAPEATPCQELAAGEVGYVATGLKNIRQVRVGDTITEIFNFKFSIFNKAEPLPGYEEPQAVVFASLYPLSAHDFPKLREGLAKLSLSDAALTYRLESSGLGRGFVVGFLGSFHAEIVKERLEREYQLSLLLTHPSVEYRVRCPEGEWRAVHAAEDFPDKTREVREPWVKVTLYAPVSFQGNLMSLCEKRRGVYLGREYLGEKVSLEYEMPLAEMLFDFYDRLKSVSAGYASLEWRRLDFRPVDAVRLDVLVHGQRAPALSRVVLQKEAYRVGAQLVARLKGLIPPHQFAVPIQAALGSHIIARETVSARRKNVLAKLSGGHRERKDKVLERQREGKKRMALFGQVEVPEEALRLTLTES